MTRISSLKRILIVLLAVLFIGVEFISWFTYQKISKPALEVELPTKDQSLEPSPFKKVSQMIYLPPTTVGFKDKSVEVEEIGIEEDGRLSVPKTWQTAGWYKEGSKPGEEGNVIIDGHYDTNTGAPGAFWELKDLQVGDNVSLYDSLGRAFEYSVKDKSYIGIKDPERAKVFESGKDKMLTLITCGGIWDYASGTYNKRLVITATFDKMEKDW